MTNDYKQIITLLTAIADKLDRIATSPPEPVKPVCAYRFYAWLEEWYTTYKAPALRPGSLREVRTCIDLHIKSHLQDVPLDKLNGLDIQKALNDISASRTRKYTYNVINGALKRALKLGIIKENPMFSVDSVPHKYKLGQALTKDQQAHFCEIIKGNKLQVFYEFLIMSGCRRGEAVGLKWSDIDRANNRLHVQGTKTDGSDRFIPLFPALSELLGKLTPKSETVFNTTANAVNCNFKRMKTKYGLPYKLHDLRHTFATRCLESGISMKTIQKWLGHSRLETTANIYTHVTTDFERDEIAKYDIRL